MPVFHIILHAFGTWHPDHPDGWHQHGVGRPLRPQPLLAQYRRGHQRWDAVVFAPIAQRDLLAMALDICDRRDWRCHAMSVNQTHVHIVASWRDQTPPMDVQTVFKRPLGWRAAKLHRSSGRRWFSDGGLPKRVEDEDHLHHLIAEYLPAQGGVFWKQGDPKPTLAVL